MKAILKVFMLVFLMGTYTGFSFTIDQTEDSIVTLSDIDIGEQVQVAILNDVLITSNQNQSMLTEIVYEQLENQRIQLVKLQTDLASIERTYNIPYLETDSYIDKQLYKHYNNLKVEATQEKTFRRARDGLYHQPS